MTNDKLTWAESRLQQTFRCPHTATPNQNVQSFDKKITSTTINHSIIIIGYKQFGKIDFLTNRVSLNSSTHLAVLTRIYSFTMRNVASIGQSTVSAIDVEVNKQFLLIDNIFIHWFYARYSDTWPAKGIESNWDYWTLNYLRLVSKVLRPLPLIFWQILCMKRWNIEESPDFRILWETFRITNYVSS